MGGANGHGFSGVLHWSEIGFRFLASLGLNGLWVLYSSLALCIIVIFFSYKKLFFRHVR